MKDKLIEIIKEAGELFKEGYISSKEVTFKAKKDLVTKYDVAIEEFLKEKFALSFPEFSLIAEESDNTNVEFNDSIIIDPIDGTTNFVNGVPHTCISVGVYKNKQPYLGIVYNPILEQFYMGTVGEGAFLNGKKISVSDDNELQTSLLSTGFPYTSGTCEADLNDVMIKMRNILPNSQDIRRLGSAALDLCYVASGIYEGYYEMNLKAWDVSAGLIIVQEAGGKITNLDGDAYVLFESKYIVASNGNIHKDFLSTLNQ